MPEIRGHFPLYPDPARMRPCVLCLEPTDVVAMAPGVGRELPIHVFCAAWLVSAYRKMQAGRLDSGGVALLEAYAGRVASLGVPSERKESS